MILGAHVSISGGIDLAIDRGQAMGATSIQTFASAPRTLQFSSFSSEAIDRYKQKRAASDISFHVFHAVYLVNLASQNPDYVNLSANSLINYQRVAGELGVFGTIVHVGSHKGNGFEQCRYQVGKALSEIIKQSPLQTMLILENAAGHKGTIGQTLDELAALFDEVDSQCGSTDNLGLCLDTQHAFASGTDGRDMSVVNAYLDEIDKKIGLSKVNVIHLNDSKVGFDSHKDRHENIGMGELGAQGLLNWLTHPRLSHLPFILEVPGVSGKGPGEKDLAAVKGLLER